ncbi:MAG: ATP synthase F1 subunit epsilon [Bacteroidia bacterium]
MKLDIITPDKKLYSGEVKSVVLPGSEGSFGILNNHAAMISTLIKGRIKVTETNQSTQTFDINGGVVEVFHNTITVLAE